VFTDLKAIVAGEDDATVLEEVRRGEKHLMDALNDALDSSDAALDPRRDRGSAPAGRLGLREDGDARLRLRVKR
jgi:hypothetical protein